MARPFNTDGVIGNKVGNMIFSDEFNSYDAGKWVPYMPHYMNANTSPQGNWEVVNSMMRMWALDPIIKENRVFCTETKFHFQFGYFEARIRCPRGAGLWPGWWTYSVDHSLAPTHEEIDFHESYCGGNAANGGQEWADGNYNPVDYDMTVWNKFTQIVSHHRMRYQTGFGPTNLAADWFIYGCLWEPDGCTFFFHGRQCGPKILHAMETHHSLNIQCWTGSASGPVFDEFKNRNHAVEVDWVRAYALSNGTSSMLNIGGGQAIDPATDGAAPTPTTPTAPVTSTSPEKLTTQQVTDDMTLAHQSTVHGINPGWEWGSAPYRGAGPVFPPDYDTHLVPWGVAGNSTSGSPATNVRIQFRKLILDVKRNGSWTRVGYFTNDTQLEGSLYTNYETNTTAPANTRNHGVDGISVKLPQEGGSFHFATKTRSPVANGAQELVSRFEARLIVDDPSLPDDRSSAKLLAVSGLDAWKNATILWNGIDSNYATDIGRFKYVTNEWRSFTSHSLWTAPSDVTDYMNYIGSEGTSGTTNPPATTNPGTTPTPTPTPTAPSGNVGVAISLHDEITIIKIRTGAGTVNAVLTNQHHILAADKAGVVDTFEDAGTHAIIFEGATDTTKRWDFTKTDGAGVESEIRGNAIKVVAMTTDTGFIDITARREGYPAQIMKMTLAKSRRTI